MGRRSRKRTAPGSRPSAAAGVGQTARVSVDDATWREFRQAIGDRSVAQVLGAFVESRVAHWHRRRVEDVSLTEDELVDAVERARVLAETLELLAVRLEARLQDRRTPVQVSAWPCGW